MKTELKLMIMRRLNKLDSLSTTKTRLINTMDEKQLITLLSILDNVIFFKNNVDKFGHCSQ